MDFYRRLRRDAREIGGRYLDTAEQRDMWVGGIMQELLPMPFNLPLLRDIPLEDAMDEVATMLASQSRDGRKEEPGVDEKSDADSEKTSNTQTSVAAATVQSPEKDTTSVAASSTGGARKKENTVPANKQITCFLCKKVGHKASECRVRQPRVTTIKCFTCQRVGHIARECRARVRGGVSNYRPAGPRAYGNGRQNNYQNGNQQQQGVQRPVEQTRVMLNGRRGVFMPDGPDQIPQVQPIVAQVGFQGNALGQGGN